MALAESEKLLGPLVDAVQSAALVLPNDATDHLAERHEATMLWCLQIEVRLLELGRWFAAAEICYLVLKGPAVAHLDERDPSARSFVDVDLLVAAEDLDRAVEVLEDRGATRPWPQRRPGFDSRFAKGVTMTSFDGIEIDLHRMICDGVYGLRVPPGELFEGVESFELGGTKMRAMSRPHRFLHAAYHAVLGSPTPGLSSLRDIARYMSAGDLAPQAVVPIARGWGGEVVLAVAVAETLSALDFDAPGWAQWLSSTDTDPVESGRIERQRREGSSIGRAKVDALREMPGTRLKAAYAFAVLWPTAEHLEARGLRRSTMWRSLLHRP